MALIKCPECGKEVSDKSISCINCGFPLNTNTSNVYTQNVCIIDGIQYDFSDLLQEVESFYCTHSTPTLVEKSKLGLSLNKKIREITGINDVAGATLASKIISLRAIPKSFTSTQHPDPISFDKSKIVCPKCGSTAITTGARGVNFTMGLIGASKTVNRCSKCGYTWKPKK